jgi:hypothetical protein
MPDADLVQDLNLGLYLAPLLNLFSNRDMRHWR